MFNPFISLVSSSLLVRFRKITNLALQREDEYPTYTLFILSHNSPLSRSLCNYNVVLSQPAQLFGHFAAGGASYYGMRLEWLAVWGAVAQQQSARPVSEWLQIASWALPRCCALWERQFIHTCTLSTQEWVGIPGRTEKACEHVCVCVCVCVYDLCAPKLFASGLRAPPGSWDGLWINRVLWPGSNCLKSGEQRCAGYRTLNPHRYLFHVHDVSC